VLGRTGAIDRCCSEAFGISNRGRVVGFDGSQPALWILGPRLVRQSTPGAWPGGLAVDVNDGAVSTRMPLGPCSTYDGWYS
jgi:hypothetical protein